MTKLQETLDNTYQPQPYGVHKTAPPAEGVFKAMLTRSGRKAVENDPNRDGYSAPKVRVEGLKRGMSRIVALGAVAAAAVFATGEAFDYVTERTEKVAANQVQEDNRVAKEVVGALNGEVPTPSKVTLPQQNH